MDFEEDLVMVDEPSGTIGIAGHPASGEAPLVQVEVDSLMPYLIPESTAQVLTGEVPETQTLRNDDAIDSQSTTEPAHSTSISTPASPNTEAKPVSKVEVKIYQAAASQLPFASSRTGLVYDARMRFHAELDPRHDDIHPEDPRRIWEIYNELDHHGLITREAVYEAAEDYPTRPHKLWRIPIRPATAAEIALCHVTDHYEWVDSLKDMTEDQLIELAHQHDSVYFHKLTFYCATLSCGGAIEACRAVVAGHVKNAIAVIRPPGHHAEIDRPAGFCFFNNVCVAARVCQNDFPDKCRKILILDWDVHHGNGVQQVFESDPNVLYISLHVHKNGEFYPKGDYGGHTHVGIGEGVGKNINIPWPCHGMHDSDYLYAFHKLVMPVAQEFDPDLVIIAAGFDAAEGDMLGGCHVTPAGYAHMTSLLSTLADGKVVVCLEGGYNLRSIAKSALAVTQTLMGEPPGRIVDISVTKPAIETVELVRRVHSQYWACLFPRDVYEERKRLGGERLHDLLRNTQKHTYWDKFEMSPLYIQRERLSKSFKDEVMATLGYEGDKPLLVIFHDPPETEGLPNPVTHKLEPHNIIVTDVVKPYIQWACNNGFSVIDVNIPEHYTEENDTEGYITVPNAEEKALLTREMATYLWENYIDTSAATDIILMGVGSAYSTLVKLLGDEERCQERVKYTISFVSDSALVGIQRPADDYIAAWYYEHSTVFVANDHFYWNPDRSRKIRRKYGDLERSDKIDLPDMMGHHADTVFELLLRYSADSRRASQAKLGDKAHERSSSNGNEVTQQYGTREFLQSSPQGLSLNGAAFSSPKGISPGLKSPVKFPQRGLFSVTSPERAASGAGVSVTGSPILR